MEQIYFMTEFKNLKKTDLLACGTISEKRKLSCFLGITECLGWKKGWKLRSKKLMLNLRVVPPFVTMHTFCASRDIWVS